MRELITIEHDTLEVTVGPETTELGWEVAPEDAEMWHHWVDCQFRWLDAIERKSGKKNSRRAYHRDVIDFFGAFAVQRLMPWKVTKRHATAWVEQLTKDGLADATINRKVAALSSFYKYAATEYDLDDGETFLWSKSNPFGAASLRHKLSAPRPEYPSTIETSRLLDRIDCTTIIGLRNYALIFGMFATTRRVSEWHALRWGDIHDGSDGKWFEYRYKGGVIKRQVLPGDAWDAIVLYLRHAGRLATMQPDDYIFVATTDAAVHLKSSKTGKRQVAKDYDPAKQPISASYVNQLIKRYGDDAGIAHAKLHAHAMRHAGARSRRKAGADIGELQETLGHAGPAVTMRYVAEVLDEPSDPYAESVGCVLSRQFKQLQMTLK